MKEHRVSRMVGMMIVRALYDSCSLEISKDILFYFLDSLWLSWASLRADADIRLTQLLIGYRNIESSDI